MSALFASIPEWVIPAIIILVSVLGLTIILERGYLLLRRIPLLNPDDERQLVFYLRQAKYEDAASFCRLQPHPAYRVVLALLEAKDSGLDAESVADEETLRQLMQLEKFLPTLGTISTVGPLLGLLGTVTGMIKSFRAYAVEQKTRMMVGIDEALITTALGLLVAIPALIMYNLYVKRVNTILEECNILAKLATDELKKKSR